MDPVSALVTGGKAAMMTVAAVTFCVHFGVPDVPSSSPCSYSGGPQRFQSSTKHWIQSVIKLICHRDKVPDIIPARRDIHSIFQTWALSLWVKALALRLLSCQQRTRQHFES